MIQQEEVQIRNQTLRKTWSDEGFAIRKIGTEEIYAEAYDVLGSPLEYEETDQLIEEEEE